MTRPNLITVAPTASDADGLATTQTIVAGSLGLILNGALASGYDVDAVAAAQTTAGAGSLSLDGVLGMAPHKLRETEERLIITTTSDNSGVTFTVTGKNKQGHPVIESLVGPVASQKVFTTASFWSVSDISVDGAITGNIEIGVNGVATFTTPQHITMTTTSDESAETWTITGTDREGRAMTETVTGPNATVAVGSENFATVTYIFLSAAATGVTAGVDGTCSTGWIQIDRKPGNFAVGVGAAVSSGATLTYSVQHTFNDITTSGFTEADATTFEHSTMTAQTASADGNYTQPPAAVRLTLTAHTSGSVDFSLYQTM